MWCACPIPRTGAARSSGSPIVASNSPTRRSRSTCAMNSAWSQASPRRSGSSWPSFSVAGLRASSRKTTIETELTHRTLSDLGCEKHTSKPHTKELNTIHSIFYITESQNVHKTLPHGEKPFLGANRSRGNPLSRGVCYIIRQCLSQFWRPSSTYLHTGLKLSCAPASPRD